MAFNKSKHFLKHIINCYYNLFVTKKIAVVSQNRQFNFTAWLNFKLGLFCRGEENTPKTDRFLSIMNIPIVYQLSSFWTVMKLICIGKETGSFWIIYASSLENHSDLHVTQSPINGTLNGDVCTYLHVVLSSNPTSNGAVLLDGVLLL